MVFSLQKTTFPGMGPGADPETVFEGKEFTWEMTQETARDGGEGAPPGWVAAMGPWGSATAHTLEAVGEAPLHRPLRAEGARGVQIPSLWGCVLTQRKPSATVQVLRLGVGSSA